MEVSSFALVQRRIGPTHFKIAVFTNLTQDHLDYHKDMEDYYQAKKMLFDICDTAIVNIDDAYGERLFGEIDCEKYSFSTEKKADFYADGVQIRSTGNSFDFHCKDKIYSIKSLMTGMFNVSNLTAVIAVCLMEGIPVESVAEFLKNYGGVRGRCEVIPTDTDYTVICDYAHTPDALENILKSVKEYTENQLVCVFGCGGNRDSAKRPKMAKSASKYAARPTRV